MPRTPAPKSHRHFVAAPLFAFVVALSLLQGVLPGNMQEPALEASVMRLSDGEVVRLSSGMQAIVYSGEGFDLSGDTPVLTEGSALVSGPGLLALHAADFALSGLAGAFHVSYHGDAVTVAAITTPVLVRQGTRIGLVPAGTQWRSPESGILPLLQAGYPLWLGAREVQPLPDRFVQRQIADLAFLPATDAIALLPESRESEPLPLWTKAPALRIGESRTEAEESWRDEVVGAYRFLVEQGDANAADVFLHDERYAPVLSSPEVRKALISLLMGLPEGATTRLPLLSFLAEDEDVWLLLSLHPTWREETWSVFGDHKNAEALSLRAFFLPESLRSPEPVSAFVIQRWAYEVRSLATPERATPLMSAVAGQVLPLISMFEEQGYPERSRRLARGLLEAAESVEQSLSPDLLASLTPLESLGRVNIDTPPPPPYVEPVPVGESPAEAVAAPAEEPAEQPAEPEPVPLPEPPVDIVPVEPPAYAPDVVERRTYTVLRDMGALFTVETTIEAVAPNTAQVRNILFSTNTGEQKFHFHFDVAKGEIDHVIIGSKEYPYSLTVEAFRDWLRR